MGGRKFRLGTHRKNEERKKQRAEPAPPPLVVSISLQLVTIPALMISLPLAAYADGRVHSSESLWVRLSSLSLPTSWIIASRTPLTLCKLRVHQEGEASRADVTFTLSISSELEWTLSFVNLKLNSTVCPLLAEMPHTLDSVAAVRCLMMLLDSTKLCIGNPDGKFLDLWRHRALTLHGSSGKYINGYILHAILSHKMCLCAQVPVLGVWMTLPFLVFLPYDMRTATCYSRLRVELFAVVFAQRTAQP